MCIRDRPSEEWKNGVGSALTAYAAGTGDWDGVVTAFVDGWAKEYKLANGDVYKRQQACSSRCSDALRQ